MAKKVLYKTDLKLLLFAGTKCYRLLDFWVKRVQLIQSCRCAFTGGQT